MSGVTLLRVSEDGRVAATGGDAHRLFGNALGRTCHRVVAALDASGRPFCHADCAKELLDGAGPKSERCAEVRGAPSRLECHRVGSEIVVLVEPQRATQLGSPHALSERERQTLALVAQGFTCREIAERLGLSASTVRTHLERARKRLDARSSGEAVAKWSRWSK